MNLPLDIQIFVNESKEFSVVTDQKISRFGDDRDILIEAYLAYYSKMLFNLGENDFTDELQSFMGIMGMYFVHRFDEGYKSDFFNKEAFRFFDEPIEGAIELKCIVKEVNDLIVVTTPWNEEVQNHKNLGLILLLSLVAFAMYLTNILDREELSNLGLYIVGINDYFKSVDGGYTTLQNIIQAPKEAIKIVENEKVNVEASDSTERVDEINSDNQDLEDAIFRNKDSENAIILAILSFFFSFTIIVPVGAIYYGIRGYTRSEQINGKGKVASIVSIVFGILLLFTGLMSWL